MAVVHSLIGWTDIGDMKGEVAILVTVFGNGQSVLQLGAEHVKSMLNQQDCHAILLPQNIASFIIFSCGDIAG